MKGIDIAKWNPVTNYALVAQQVDFAVLKIINKQNNEDGLFATNLNGCRANNIPLFGVYNYSYAANTVKAITDAQAVINVLKRHNLNTIVWLDVEEESIAKSLGKALMDVIYAFKNTIEAAGYKFGIYTGLSFYNSHIKPFIGNSQIPMWIARYPSSSPMTINQNPNPEKKPDVSNIVAWQYTSKGQISGIKGNVDLDISYVTYDELMDYHTSADVNVKPILKKGSRGEYVRSWQIYLNLHGYSCGVSDGIFGSKTEKAVKAYQRDRGLVPDGIIGPKTWATI
jgi:GH25 family lysozyme M1 (1,4-beta-N-acetylmuramidase)